MRFKRRRAPEIPEIPERPRSIILGRSLADDPTDGDPSAFDEFLIESLSNLPASRFRSIFAEAIGRARLAIELAIIELDPGGGATTGELQDYTAVVPRREKKPPLREMRCRV